MKMIFEFLNTDLIMSVSEPDTWIEGWLEKESNEIVEVVHYKGLPDKITRTPFALWNSRQREAKFCDKTTS